MSNNKSLITLRAHEMRLAPTDSEARLWRALRSGHLGVAFRRQVPLLGFIADFYAPSLRLIVEVDGGYHARRASADARRDRKLARAGYRVLRVEAAQVMRELPAAIAKIVAALEVLPPSQRRCSARDKVCRTHEDCPQRSRRFPTSRNLGVSTCELGR